MKNYKVNFGAISVLIGIILCVVKGSGVALTTWAWWWVTAPIWTPPLCFMLFMLFLYLVVGARRGSDAIITSMADKDEPAFTAEQHRQFTEWLQEHGGER